MSPPAVAIFDPCKSTEMTTEISFIFYWCRMAKNETKKTHPNWYGHSTGNGLIPWLSPIEICYGLWHPRLCIDCRMNRQLSKRSPFYYRRVSMKYQRVELEGAYPMPNETLYYRTRNHSTLCPGSRSLTVIRHGILQTRNIPEFDTTIQAPADKTPHVIHESDSVNAVFMSYQLCP